jgi:hypothetical protein
MSSTGKEGLPGATEGSLSDRREPVLGTFTFPPTEIMLSVLEVNT